MRRAWSSPAIGSGAAICSSARGRRPTRPRARRVAPLCSTVPQPLPPAPNPPAPRASLGALFAATSLADLLWPVFLLLGWERAHVAPGPNPFLTLWLHSLPLQT